MLSIVEVSNTVTLTLKKELIEGTHVLPSSRLEGRRRQRQPKLLSSLLLVGNLLQPPRQTQPNQELLSLHTFQIELKGEYIYRPWVVIFFLV